MNGQQFYLPGGKTLFPVIGVRASYDDPLFTDDRMQTTFIESGKISVSDGKGGLCSADATHIKNVVDSEFNDKTINQYYSSATVLIELITNTYLSEDGLSYDYEQKIRVVAFGNYYDNLKTQSDTLYDKVIQLPHSVKPSQKLIGSCTMSWQDKVDDSVPADWPAGKRFINQWRIYNKNNPNNHFTLISVHLNSDVSAISVGPTANLDPSCPILVRDVTLEDLTVSYAITDAAVVLNKVATKIDKLENQVESLAGTTLGRFVAR